MCFSHLSGCDLIGLSSSFSIAIGKTLSAEDLTTLATFITALGDNLTIIATQKSLKESDKTQKCTK